MLEAEKYKNEILNITKQGKSPALIDGKIVPCHDCTSCMGCLFNAALEMGDCTANMINWLYSEYEPQKPKLTKREHALCEVVGTGWLARDKNGGLALFNEKPEKTKTMWTNTCGNNLHFFSMSFFPTFDFIKWEDEPYSIEEMLGWEVKE